MAVITDFEFRPAAGQYGCGIWAQYQSLCAITYGSTSWEPQIEMTSRAVIQSIRYNEDPQGLVCGSIQGNVQEICAFDSAGDPDWQNFINLVEQGVITDFEVGNDEQTNCPTISATKEKICLFETAKRAEEAGGLDFVEQLVIVGFTDDGECIYPIYASVCVATADEEVTGEEAIICGVDCESSGSGSGQA
jgi:hypothetical protein